MMVSKKLETIRSRKQIMSVAIAVAIAVASWLAGTFARVDAQEIVLPKNSKLQELVESYVPNDYAKGEDPLEAQKGAGPSDAMVKKGWEFLRNHDSDTALKRFLMGVRFNPDNATAYFGVAYTCSVTNDLDDAIVFYRLALKHEKNYAPIYFNLARALLMKNAADTEAQGLLDQAVKVDPKAFDAYFLYGSFYISKGEWDKAADMMRRAHSAGGQYTPDMIEQFKKHNIQL